MKNTNHPMKFRKGQVLIARHEFSLANGPDYATGVVSVARGDKFVPLANFEDVHWTKGEELCMWPVLHSSGSVKWLYWYPIEAMEESAVKNPTTLQMLEHVWRRMSSHMEVFREDHDSL